MLKELYTPIPSLFQFFGKKLFQWKFLLRLEHGGNEDGSTLWRVLVVKFCNDGTKEWSAHLNTR